MTGPVALIGGGEHREGCEPIDRWLMERVGTGRVRVAVVPAASGRRTLPATAALARTYWQGLGASVVLADPRHRSTAHALRAIGEADVVVLTGGVPDRLVGTMGASPLWDRILERWAAGAALSGSSAGAMVLFAWRLRLLPPQPLGLVPGLGPLRGHVAVPHFERFVGTNASRRAWAGRTARGFGGLGVVGLDERTGLVGAGGQFVVRGQGRVTVLAGGTWTAYPPGASVRLAGRAPAEPSGRGAVRVAA